MLERFGLGLAYANKVAPSFLCQVSFHCGERLKGCPDCNVWVRRDGSRRKIPEDDIAALKAVTEKPSRVKVH